MATKKEEAPRQSKAVFHTLRELLKFKSFALLSELALISKVPRLEVVQVLNKNKFLIIPQGAGVKAFNPKVLINVKYKFKQVYRVNVYGVNVYEKTGFLYFEGWDTDPIVTQHGKMMRHQPDPYSYSITSFVLLDTPENRKLLEDRGMISDALALEQLNLADYWDEL